MGNDYVRNALNTKPNSEYSEETDAHDYVRNELNTESTKDEKSGQTVNLECTKISDKDQQPNFDLEHVLSKSPGSQNKNVQMGTNTESKYSSSLSGPDKMENIKSDKLKKS